MSACRSRRPARCRLGRFRSLLRQLGIVGVAEGFHEHLHSLGQRLDVPSKDFCLGWLALCPSTSLAPWWSGALRTRWGRAIVFLDVLVGVLVHGPGARGDSAGSATMGTRWVRRPVGATGQIDGRHVALGPGGDLTCDGSWWAASAAGGPRGSEYSEQWPPEYPVPTELLPPRPNGCSQSSIDPSREGCPVVGDDRVINSNK
ncbi:hypothetical protein TIFTF001_050705 [Ficus carica]|uniref:Uncharacterized protein n=1 Tax=Ficus carica TaxID=3494 RepID=A0AA87Z9N7_FICCA|nr:hypothetical protein TIFTF001_050705 [Ficus carica]